MRMNVNWAKKREILISFLILLLHLIATSIDLASIDTEAMDFGFELTDDMLPGAIIQTLQEELAEDLKLLRSGLLEGEFQWLKLDKFTTKDSARWDVS